MLIRYILVGVLLVILLLPVFGDTVFAQSGISITDKDEVKTKILDPIFNWMFSILLSLSGIMVLVAAYMYVTAGGKSEQVSQATKIIAYAAAGVVVALFAKGFPAVIRSVFNIS